jgi:hypothetical protein
MHMVIVIGIMVVILLGLWSARRTYKADERVSCAARRASRAQALGHDAP